jgi:lipopolysaccharide transport system permease protein
MPAVMALCASSRGNPFDSAQACYQVVKTGWQTARPLSMFRELLAPYACAWKNRFIVLSMAKREVIGRYRGSALGLLWSFVNPLLMLALYTFFFRYIFNAKWPQVGDTTADYAIMLFAGLIVHGMAAEIMSRSTGLIVGNANLVKKLLFPIEVLPWVTLLSALFHTAVSFLVLLCFLLFSGGHLHWSLLMLPLVLTPMALLFLGIAWFLSALGVYFRDVEQVIGSLVVLLLFTSTVFFSIENAPEEIRPILLLNPITEIINSVRKVVVYGVSPDWYNLAVYGIVAVTFMQVGWYFFKKTRNGFGDVL